MRTRIAIVIGLQFLAALCGPLHAAPWDFISPKRVEADPERTYSLEEGNGPWMILAVTFSGDEAERQANELVLELRKRYKLPAFVHPMEIDLTQAESRGTNSKGKPHRMRYQRGEQIREIAVLVGNYPAVDDVQAQRDLKKIKFLKPECLEIREGRKVSRPLAALRLMQQQIQSGFLDEKKSAYVQNVKAGRGPLGNAFITTNPLLPRDYYVGGGLDKEIVEMNRGVKHSLLDCPGRYSVKVATFTGSVIIDPQKIKEIEAGKEMPSKLIQAAEDAHEMTEALRAKGYEAYEFHDLYSSLVCVGSFDSVGTPQPGGQVLGNPAVLKIMEEFGGQKQMVAGQVMPRAVQPRTIKLRGREIPFDLQPLPIEVPRQAIASQQARVERF